MLQDLGNLNITVFTHRKDYNRPRNLNLVCDAVNKTWSADLRVSKRDDILYADTWKVGEVETTIKKYPLIRWRGIGSITLGHKLCVSDKNTSFQGLQWIL